MIELQSIDEALDDNGVKILVHAPAGNGKTVLCATAGLPTILISAESGLLSLKKFMRDNPEMKKLVKIQTISSLEELDEVLEWLEDSVQLCDWIALDSISEIAEQVLNYEKANNKDPRAAYGNLTDTMLDRLRRFRDLDGYNVIMTCKQVREVDADTERTRFVPMFPGRQVGPAVPYLFDEVFASRVEEETDEDGEVSTYRTLQTSRDVHYEAKDRSGELDMFEEADLEVILSKIDPDYICLADQPDPEPEEDEEDGGDPEEENDQAETEADEEEAEESLEGESEDDEAEEESAEETEEETEEEADDVEAEMEEWFCCDCDKKHIAEDEPEQCSKKKCGGTEFYQEDE